MIPVIGIPIVNGVHWLDRLIKSVDFPVQELFIVNNSGNDEISNQIQEVASQSNPNINRIRVCHLPANIGCAGAWNLIIKSYILSPYWIISNHDIEFSPGILQGFYNAAAEPDVGMVHISEGDSRGSFECFLIKDWVVDKFGLFDEHFYPAYTEDVDYSMRVDGRIKKHFLTIPFLHGETTDYAVSGGNSFKTCEEPQRAIMREAYRVNNEYLARKWGPEWKNFNRYNNPFNNPNRDLSYVSYNLLENRSKFVKF